MAEMQNAFQIDTADNVATALTQLQPGNVSLLGDAVASTVDAVEDIPVGHKIALRDIPSGNDIVKYGVSIGKATVDIRRGGWVHLHCMGSAFDEKSNTLDPVTGTSAGTRY